jgi:hypothetical protein
LPKFFFFFVSEINRNLNGNVTTIVSVQKGLGNATLRDTECKRSEKTRCSIFYRINSRLRSICRRFGLYELQCIAARVSESGNLDVYAKPNSADR